VPVHERRYRGIAGKRLQRWGFLILARYGLAEVFASRLVLVLFVIACLPFAVAATLIYAASNVELLALFQVPDAAGLRHMLSGSLFFWYTVGQANLAFLLASFAGPSLVGPDLTHGALPLYLSRPLGRGDYVLGKLTVLLALLSPVTWLPGLLLVLLHGALAEEGLQAAHLRLAWAIAVGSGVWILLLSLLSLAISAWIRWRPLATGALFAIVVVGSAFGTAINETLDTRWGKLLMPAEMVKTIWLDLFAVPAIFGRSPAEDLPVAACWLGLAAFGGAAVLLLARKIRACEVVR
jgi:ABC-2 type transport system permease protein